MIEREERDGVVTLRLAHGKASALDVEILEGLERELDTIQQSDARAVVLTGTGSIFSAGVDLFRVLDGGAVYVRRFLPALTTTFRKLFAFPKPIVAAVNGHAIAGGAIVAAACDYRLMARGGGRIGVPELIVGVPFPAMALEVLRFALPSERLQEIVYTGTTYPSEEALERGFVDDLVEPDLLAERAHQIASDLGAIAPEAFALAKRQLRAPAVQRADVYAVTNDDDALAAWSSPETHDRIRAYLAKTIGKRT